MSAKAARDLSLDPFEVKVLPANSKVWNGGKFGVCRLCGWQHSQGYAASLLILKDLLLFDETGVTLAALAFGNWGVFHDPLDCFAAQGLPADHC